MARDMQAIINAAVQSALAAQGTAAVPQTATTKAPESKEAREVKKLALAKALPDSGVVFGITVPLTFTGSRKGKEFTGHAVINGVKSRVNGYVMPE